MAPRKRIAWKMRTNGKSGHGNWFEPSTDLVAIVAKMNRNYPWIDHWIEYESWTEIDTSAEDTEIID